MHSYKGFPMASGGDSKKNVILIAITVLLLVGAVVFGFRESLFAGRPSAEASEAAAASDEVVNRITGGQPVQPEPDPTTPMPEPGSGRRARPAEPVK